MAEPKVMTEVPWSNELTDYDRTHLTLYLRLLDAHADGATHDDMARIVLGIDPQQEPERAQRAVVSHLRRALWMTEHGYRDLLRR